MTRILIGKTSKWTIEFSHYADSRSGRLIDGGGGTRQNGRVLLAAQSRHVRERSVAERRSCRADIKIGGVFLKSESIVVETIVCQLPDKNKSAIRSLWHRIKS